MTALIIIAAIAVLLFVLLASSITAELEYDRVFKFKIKYLFFTIAKDPLSPKEQKKKKRKEEKKARKAEKADKKTVKKKPAHSAEKASTPPEKKSEAPLKSPHVPSDKSKNDQPKKSQEKNKASKSKITPELVFGIWGKAKPHIKRIFKKIRITDVYADIVVGGEDAAKTAISYGVHCAAVNSLAAFLENTVTFKSEKINIRADFDLEKSVYFAKATVKLRLSTLLHSGIWGAAAIYGELKSLTADSEALKDRAPQKAA